MTKLLLTLLISASMFAAGCATPAYTAGLPTTRLPDEKNTGENMNNIVRIWVLENRMMIDDINAFLLTDQPSQLSRWHIR